MSPPGPHLAHDFKELPHCIRQHLWEYLDVLDDGVEWEGVLIQVGGAHHGAIDELDGLGLGDGVALLPPPLSTITHTRSTPALCASLAHWRILSLSAPPPRIPSLMTKASWRNLWAPTPPPPEALGGLARARPITPTTASINPATGVPSWAKVKEDRT